MYSKLSDLLLNLPTQKNTVGMQKQLLYRNNFHKKKPKQNKKKITEDFEITFQLIFLKKF